jgi:hypothetical protein
LDRAEVDCSSIDRVLYNFCACTARSAVIEQAVEAVDTGAEAEEVEEAGEAAIQQQLEGVEEVYKQILGFMSELQKGYIYCQLVYSPGDQGHEYRDYKQAEVERADRILYKA